MDDACPLPPRVADLLVAVRHRLWLADFLAAARVAGWSAAAAMTIVAAAHLFGVSLGAPLLIVAAALPWLLMLLATAFRRPSLARCALWADRHLDGANAYSTLIEVGPAPLAVPRALTPADQKALRWLHAWAASQAERSLTALHVKGAPRLPVRPIGAMLVAAASAAVLLSLPPRSTNLARTAESERVATDNSSLARPLEVADERVAALASLLRQSSQLSHATQEAQSSPQSRVDAGLPEMARPTAADARGTSKQLPLAATADASDAAQQAGVAEGSTAGGAHDTRANSGISIAPQAPIHRAARIGFSRPSDQQHTDPEQGSTYDGARANSAAVAAPTAGVAPATPPAATTESLRLTPASAAYLQAWLAQPRTRTHQGSP